MIYSIRNSLEGIKTKDSSLKPFTSDTDERSELLRYTFLPYLTNWKLLIENREDFSQSEKRKCSFHGKHMKV